MVVRPLLALGVAALAAAAVGGLAAPAGDPPSDTRGKVDLVVATAVNGRCGKFAGTLPPLVVDASLGPGGRSTPVDVCLSQRGPATGLLTLSVADVQETDTECAESEAAADATCGGGQAGELGSILTQEVASATSCANGRPSTYQSQPAAPFTQLAAAPLVLATSVEPYQVVCLRLSLRASSADAAFTPAQSDRLTWKYVFSLRA